MQAQSIEQRRHYEQKPSLGRRRGKREEKRDARVHSEGRKDGALAHNVEMLRAAKSIARCDVT